MKSQCVIKQKDAHIKQRGDLKVIEYPDINKDVSVVYAELNGRHPANGYIINKNSNETYLVHEGSGEIYMDGVVTKFSAGDVVPIKKGTKYYCNGKNMKFWCAINPPWRKTQEQVVLWFDINDFVIDWRITSKCHNACKYCYASKNIQQLSLDDENYILEEIINCGCKTVCISGGEPLIDIERTSRILKKLNENGINIYLSTTGENYLENANQIENKIAKLSLSLDGYDKASNIVHGRNEKDFDNVLKILDYYKKHKHNFTIKIGTVLTTKNLSIEYFQKMYELLKCYPIDLWKIYEFIPENRGQENYDELKIKSSNLRKFKRQFNKAFKNTAFPIKIMTKKSRSKAYFIIQPDGSVIVPTDINRSCTKDVFVGDLKNESINDVFIKWSKLVNKNRANKNWTTRKIVKK